jgi:hypothetical protein
LTAVVRRPAEAGGERLGDDRLRALVQDQPHRPQPRLVPGQAHHREQGLGVLEGRAELHAVGGAQVLVELEVGGPAAEHGDEVGQGDREHRLDAGLLGPEEPPQGPLGDARGARDLLARRLGHALLAEEPHRVTGDRETPRGPLRVGLRRAAAARAAVLGLLAGHDVPSVRADGFAPL